ncbi:NHL repeat-containing protein [Mucilaginibacter pineti]|uniref:NHL repeat-containing protein n=1 Tax=Mucilaginibacter pineti TaxID=1391627 RepID=A0A1G7DLK2_9SPHI|nr:IPT/TIG domain-containing protein [Mucilaginibacter pineti]SDE51685.1 NHL repeat-containing protein [Mucilaginibacter pineti]
MRSIKSFVPVLLVLFIALTSITSCSKGSDPAKPPETPPVETQPVSNDITITNVYPFVAGNGEIIKISGTNFLTGDGTNKVTLNGMAFDILKQTNTTIQAIIPKMAGSGPIIVTRNGKTYRGSFFTYVYRAEAITIAGTGAIGAQDGYGPNATFSSPQGIAADDNGNLYVADCLNSVIRKINLTYNTVSTIPFKLNGSDYALPEELAYDHKNNVLYVADLYGNVVRVNADKTINAVYKSTYRSTGITVGPDGFLYLSLGTAGTIMKVSTDGKQVTKIASGLLSPGRIIFDSQNNMFVQAIYPGSGVLAIFRVTDTDKIVVAQDKAFQGIDVALDVYGNFYGTDYLNNCLKLIDKGGNVTIIAGNGFAKEADGIDLASSFKGPIGITIDKLGDIYMTTDGNKIRKIVVE